MTRCNVRNAGRLYLITHDLLLYCQVIIACLMIVRASCYGSGAPLDACSELHPHHFGQTPQNSTSPYRIHLEKYTYVQGEHIRGREIPLIAFHWEPLLSYVRYSVPQLAIQ